MKKLTYLLYFLVCALAPKTLAQSLPYSGAIDKKATPQTQNLLVNLKKLASKGIMFGHQDDLAYGVGWAYQEGQSDIKRVSSDYPAVYGWDLGHLEIGSPYNLDSVPFSKIKNFVQEVYSRGGVNTFSWHGNNPLTGGNTWDNKSNQTVNSILPGGAKHELFKQWLDRLAGFFLSLKDSQGTPIPVIFRPYHENTGSWFWWGEKLCSAEEYKKLWHFTVDYLSHAKNVHNLLYAYSPTSAFDTKDEFYIRYPGDDYVDLVGFDTYQFNSDNTQFSSTLSNKLELLVQIAKEKGKVAALTETGYEQVPYPKWWTEVLWPAIQGKNISYVLVWRNAHNKPNHYYAPHPGQMSEKDFKKFYELPETLFQQDVTKKIIYE